MQGVKTSVRVDNVTIEKSASQEIQAKAGILVRYSDKRSCTFIFDFDPSLIADIVITGLGFRPTSIFLFGAESGGIKSTFGVADGTTSANIAMPNNAAVPAAGFFASGAGTILAWAINDNANQNYILFKSFDSDGLTLDRNHKLGNAGGIIKMVGIAFR